MNVNLPRTFEILGLFEDCIRIEDVMRLTKKMSSVYGADYIMFGKIPAKNLSPSQQKSHLLFGCIPREWADRYFKERYLDIDPAIDHVRNRDSALDWAQIHSRGLSESSSIVMNEARDFRMRDGLTIPHLSLDGVRIGASFSGEKLDHSLEARTYFNVLSAAAIMRVINIMVNSERDTLTQREKECLLWVSEGKSDWEISQILGVSHKTIEKHMKNCRVKLNAMNRTHSIVKAINFGLIR